MAKVLFEGVSKRFGDVAAVDKLDLEITDGELLVLLGPSGCGKTTALRMVAGLEEVSDGSLSIGDDVVNDVDPKDRDVAMVFQSYALYPHMTVARNIEFPLRQQRMDAAERTAKVAEAAGTLGLGELLDRKPGQLSGGQRQRVALARAIVRDPKVFLMDEPLSNLDAKLRVQTRADIVSLQRRLGTTTIYVTHDQVEAMTMGHRIAVMQGGKLQQVAPPEELYERPANTFVAAFLGSPGMNLLEAERVGDKLITPAGEINVPEHLSAVLDGPVTLGIRPEGLHLSTSGLAGTILLVEMLGAETQVHCSLEGGATVVVRQGHDAQRPTLGDPVVVGVDAAALHAFGPDGTRVAGT